MATAPPNDIDPAARAVFDAIERAKHDLIAHFPEHFSSLYPFVPFVISDIPTNTDVCIALKGRIAAKVPQYWDYDAASQSFTPEEHAVLREMTTTVISILGAAGIMPKVSFDAQARIDDVGSFYYFR